MTGTQAPLKDASPPTDVSPGTAARGVEAATEQVAKRFTRAMRAATSRWGALTDPSLVAVSLAVDGLVASILYRGDIIALSGVYALLALPFVVAMAVDLTLRSARRDIIAWLSQLPFPVENVNALLNGVAQHLVVRFGTEPPSRAAISALLDEVHEDCFALEFHEVEPEVELFIGVPESKLNPAAASHRRFMRVRRMLDACVVPLSDAHAVQWVRVA